MTGLHDAPRSPVSLRAKTGWGSAVIAVAAGIYSLITGASPIPHSTPAPRPRESRTTGAIPRVGSPSPRATLIPSKSSTFVKASPSGSHAPVRTQVPSPKPRPTTTPRRTSSAPSSSIPPSKPIKGVVGVVTGAVRAAAVVAFLHLQVGKPYVYGGNGPLAYDCSGLVVAAFKPVGIQLPRTSDQQASTGTPVSLRDLLPGDILFWGSPATHSAVYVGGGKFIGAENQALGVALEPVAWDPPSYARRVL